MSLKPYLVQLSNKQTIKITSDELEAITSGVKSGSMIRLRQGIINPSFIVAVVADTDAWNDHLGQVTGINGSDEWEAKRKKLAEIGVRPQKDVFSNVFGGKETQILLEGYRESLKNLKNLE